MALLLSAIAVWAADVPTLEKQLINPCPNCGGMPLAGSYCGGAMEAKAKLKALAVQGKTDEEIRAAFVAEYGEWILATPPRKGFNLFAWVLPAVGMVLGGGALALFLKRSRGPTGRPSLAAAPADPTSPLAADDPARARYREMLRRELGDGDS